MQSLRNNRNLWSVLTAFIAVIWTSQAFTGVWGAFCPTVQVASVAEALSDPLDHEDSGLSAGEHARVCKCLHCPGGKRCCCLSRTSSTPAEQILLTARCDSEMPARTVAAAAAKIVFPAAVILPAVYSVTTPLAFPPVLRHEIATRETSPLLPPPRLS